MSEILNFACPVNNCGRKFESKEKLDNHIKLRHNSISSNIITNSKFKENKKDESDLKIKKLKEENKKFEINKEKEENKTNDDKTKIKDEKKEKLQKEKNKIILDDLYSKINSLENYFENENLELQKQFELPEMPIIDDILLENEKIEQNENKDIKDNESNNNNINTEINKDEDKNKKNETKNKKDENIDKKIPDIKNKEDHNIENDLNEQQKNYDKDKIITITEDLIISNSDSQNEDLEDITKLNLSKKNIASFMNNREVDFSEIPNLKNLNLSYNWMTYTYDIRLFTNLEEVYLNDNKIDDISFCEKNVVI